MSVFDVAVIVAQVWLVLAVVVALLVGRAIRLGSGEER